jgi:SAM-dependent methyltransferase
MNNYNTSRHSDKERLNPRFWQPRYVHLKLLRKSVERVIEKYIHGNHVSKFGDFGCGNMPYRELIKPHVGQYLGIDLPGNPKADVLIDEKTNRSALADESCDVVWSVQVLEHVADPVKYLQECYRILKKNGKLILCTHGHWQYHPDPIDYWRWTSEGLKVTIAREDFKIIESFGMMGLLPMSLQLFQDAVLLSFPFVRVWRIPFQIVIQFWIGLAEKFTSISPTLRSYTDRDACVFFVIATK